MVQEPASSEVFVMTSPVSKRVLVGHEREQQRRGAIADINHHVGVIACNETRQLRTTVIESVSSHVAHGMKLTST